MNNKKDMHKRHILNQLVAIVKPAYEKLKCKKKWEKTL